jgi:hypothetical protein
MILIAFCLTFWFRLIWFAIRVMHLIGSATKSIEAKWHPTMAEGGLRFRCTELQCTHYIIMLQRMVLFMALLQDLSPIQCPSPIFILCDKCFWCATYFDMARLSTGNRCPQCGANNNEPLPIMSNESFTFNHSHKRGVELKFMDKHRRNSS